jgi:hypothetical protein
MAAAKKATKRVTKRAVKPEEVKVEAKAVDTSTPPTDRTYAQDRMALKRKVRMFYDLQRLRLQISGRLYKRPGGSTIDLHPYDISVLDRRAEELERAEKSALADVEEHLKQIPFYRDVLSDKARYRGIGPTMAGVILAEYDINKLDTASKMWAFAGLAPIPAYRCRQCHSLMSVEDSANDSIGPESFVHTSAQEKCTFKGTRGKADVYESGRAMRPTKGEKLPYNAFLKTKLVGVLGPVLLQLGVYRCTTCKELVAKDKKEAGKFVHRAEACRKGDDLTVDDVVFTDRPSFVKFYEDYKHRKISENWGRSDAHRHQASIRYMIKMMLLQIWKDWREYMKLPVRPSYQEEKLGHVHGAAPKVKARGQTQDMPPEVLADIEAEVERLAREL